MSKKSILLIKDTKYDRYYNLLNSNFNEEYDFVITNEIENVIEKFRKNHPFLILIDFETTQDILIELNEIIENHRKLKNSVKIFLIDKKNLPILSSYSYDDFITKQTTKEEFVVRFSTILSRISIKYERDSKSKEQKELLKEKEKLNQVLRARDLALNKSAAVAVVNKKGVILFINDKFCSLSKYSKHELIGRSFESILYTKKNDISMFKTLWISIYRGEIWRGEICSVTKNKKLLWTDTSVSPIYDDLGKINKFFSVHFDITDRIIMEKELQEKNYSVTTSISYASRIQKALLPSEIYLNENLKEHFVLYMPRDIVSGDFYWVKQISNLTVVAVADCTGHGVPGAFMSMLGVSFLTEIVTYRNSKIPSQILNELRLMVKKSLHQEDFDNVLDDGMDITIFSIEKNTNKLYFAGALNCIYIIRNSNLEEISGKNITKIENEYFNLYQIDGDEMPIGLYYKEELFQTTTIQLVEDDLIIGFSDGIIDQLGGPYYQKFSSKRFKQLLLNNCLRPLSEQKTIIHEAFKKWTGNKKYRQIDDILIMGIKY